MAPRFAGCQPARQPRQRISGHYAVSSSPRPAANGIAFRRIMSVSIADWKVLRTGRLESLPYVWSPACRFPSDNVSLSLERGSGRQDASPPRRAGRPLPRGIVEFRRLPSDKGNWRGIEDDDEDEDECDEAAWAGQAVRALSRASNCARVCSLEMAKRK